MMRIHTTRNPQRVSPPAEPKKSMFFDEMRTADGSPR